MKILFISIAFPPKNDPESLQAGRYAKYLVRNGARLQVVTSRIPTLYMPYDKTLEEYSHRDGKAIELPVIETRVSNFVMRKISPIGLDYPDSKFSFPLQWRRVTRRVDERPDIIYSRSNPLSSSLMGYHLAQHFKAPWVMHMSDPWVDSPARNYTRSEFRFNAGWEERCMRLASRVSVTTLETMRYYQRKYPAFDSKYFLSPNVYDPEKVGVRLPDFGERMRIVYTGGLAGNRTPEFFLDACRQALAKDAGFANIEVIFAGPADRRNRAILESADLDFVRYVGNVSYAETRELQQHAHLLLTIDEPVADKQRAMFLPSKILDYFLTGRRILAITNEGSSTSAILTTCGALVVHYPDVALLTHHLQQAREAFERRDASYFSQEQLPQQFSASENAGKLITLFETL